MAGTAREDSVLCALGELREIDGERRREKQALDEGRERLDEASRRLEGQLAAARGEAAGLDTALAGASERLAGEIQRAEWAFRELAAERERIRALETARDREPGIATVAEPRRPVVLSALVLALAIGQGLAWQDGAEHRERSDARDEVRSRELEQLRQVQAEQGSTLRELAAVPRPVYDGASSDAGAPKAVVQRPRPRRPRRPGATVRNAGATAPSGEQSPAEHRILINCDGGGPLCGLEGVSPASDKE